MAITQLARNPDYPPRGVVLPLLGVVNWSQSRTTARPIQLRIVCAKQKGPQP
jgi:hypothetical protein